MLAADSIARDPCLEELGPLVTSGDPGGASPVGLTWEGDPRDVEDLC